MIPCSIASQNGYQRRGNADLPSRRRAILPLRTIVKGMG